MLMDCIQFALVMRFTHTQMYWDRKTRARFEETNIFSVCSEAGREFNSKREPSSSSTLPEIDSLSRQIVILFYCLPLTLHYSTPCFSLFDPQINLRPTFKLETMQSVRCVLEKIPSPKSRYMHKKRVPQKSVAKSTKKNTTIHFIHNIISFPLHTTNTGKGEKGAEEVRGRGKETDQWWKGRKRWKEERREKHI